MIILKDSITLIGDVHGKYEEYFNIAWRSEFSIQLGDFGFSREWNRLGYSGLDSNKHKVLAGNHDDYNTCMHSPFCLGDFGMSELGEIKFFFLRGGISIDRTFRDADRINNGPTTYWQEEELNFNQMLECISLYKIDKPDIVLSHAPPGLVIPYLHDNQNILKRFGFKEDFIENTSRLGDELLKIHKPKTWVFGHHHKSLNKKINGVHFIGLDELEVIDI